MHHGSILVESPGNEKEYLEKLINAFDKMVYEPEVLTVKNTYQSLEESTIKARQAIEEILEIGLIPNRCNVCSRLGM